MLPLLAESFATLAIGAPAKRKAAGGEGGGGPSRAGHYGLRDDSSASLALVALSRIARARDDGILQPASQTPVGSALLSLLKAAVLRVALAVGGADGSLNAQSVTSLFNLGGSVIAADHARRGDGLGLRHGDCHGGGRLVRELDAQPARRHSVQHRWYALRERLWHLMASGDGSCKEPAVPGW